MGRLSMACGFPGSGWLVGNPGAKNVLRIACDYFRIPGEHCELPTANGAGYSRSNTSTSGSLRPDACTVIVNVFPSGETLISRVSTTFPPALSVISRVCSSTRRLEKEEPGFAFGPSLG